MKKFIIFSIIILVALSSCEKDEGLDVPTMSKHIGYEVSLKDGFRQGKTKSGLDGASDKSIRIDELDGKLREKSLFLHTEIQDRTDEFVGTTKGTELSETVLPDDLGVSAWIYDQGAYISGKLYFINEKYGVGSGEVTTGRYWPDKDNGSNMRFYAFAPYDIQKDDDLWTDGVPSFNYAVSDDISKQQDLLVASKDVENENFGEKVPLRLGHALTAVQFMISSDVSGFKIKKIVLSGVKYEGNYIYENKEGKVDSEGNPLNPEVGGWTITNSADEFATYELDFGDGFDCSDRENWTEEEKNEGKLLNTGEEVMFLMPQNLPSGATITMIGDETFDGGETDVQLTASIGGNTWEKGKKVVYKLSASDVSIVYVLDVKDITVATQIPGATKISSNEVVPYYGQVGRKFKVRSYKKIYGLGSNEPEIVPVPWKIKENNGYGETDDNKTSHWVDYISQWSGTGIVDESEGSGEECSYSVIAIETEKNDGLSHTRMLSKGVKGQDGAYDLSKTEGSMNTANCYIVDGPGYYKLPLVYGNAIQNGSTNKGSYKTDISNGTAILEGKVIPMVLSTFINYNGNEIASEWIPEDTKISELGAEVVWQDEPCLITEAYIEGNYLHFRIREDCVCEGNAVVAVKDASSNTILWSWHIWVTDNEGGLAPINIGSRRATEIDANGIESFTTEQFKIMGVPLGFCRQETKVYNRRDVKIAFYQTEDSGISKNLIVPQGNKDVETVIFSYNAVYYQYGRKDPFHPAYDGLNKPYYSEKRDQFTLGYGGGRVGFNEDSQEQPILLYYGIQTPGKQYSVKHIDTYYLEITDGQFKHWMTDRYNFVNLWNTDCNLIPEIEYPADATSYGVYSGLESLMEIGVTKTIYDPSPYGYEMPRIDAFAGITYEGLNYSGWSEGYNVNVGSSYGADRDNALGNFNGYYGFYANPLTAPFSSSSPPIGDGEFKVWALGHRNDISGSITNGEGGPTFYGNFGSALTSSPICVKWGDGIYSVGLPRLCYIVDYNTYTGGDNQLDRRVFKPIATSNLSMAFPVMPAKTGANPIKQ